ncbi:CPBP family intramembrane metalloprotease [Corynebacterium urealyticum]|uniref:Putative membrane protein n=1 Tax=Corynebacterium urealyticum (strain ATCC 43042 / DSM 7109) TaxID=504474 RepID=B1VEA3_CORU7|nr:CPBP family intramembrane glutamic endopeptidase [Corynebacterium urealyticum]AGE35739.1 putative membrane protein [Corynebacterium urealyticum DSM 7111]QQB07376.1 CPBP family intramembrane metalloprotease [Corynebacterium urealyticum]QQC42371.1 CPBP family intramembrane metalloprotease [Corynebacterium urealyticum]QQE51002.1 CPBP family intramembrane metalloprotease [Corynebacterium urealyticum]TYR15269.1 CPBP family intramembrane metalloprotease [Corynebacterium urealyticum]
MSAELLPRDRRALRVELALLLAVTFGASGLRATLRLVEALTDPTPLNEQEALLNQSQSHLAWLDPAFQLITSGVLLAWGGLAAFLLLRHLPPQPAEHLTSRPALRLRIRAKDWPHGAGLAALIGLPGLAFYALAVHLGASKVVVPSGLGEHWWTLPSLLLNAWANGVAEELIVVAWLATRLRQLNVRWPAIFAASALLRASYHLYQGLSAGLGNAVMGLIFIEYFRRTGRVWPLVIAHGLIDTVAFAGYALGGGGLVGVG